MLKKLREKIENNIVIFFLTILLLGFCTVLSAYKLISQFSQLELSQLKNKYENLQDELKNLRRYNYPNEQINKSLENIRYRGNALIVVQTETEIIIENIYESLIAIRISWDKDDPFGTGMGKDSFINNSVIPGVRINRKFDSHSSVQIWAWGPSGVLIDSYSIILNRVEISSPQNGDIVTTKTIVRGKSKIYDNSSIWILIHPKDFKGNWWPQRNPLIIDKNGNWKVSIYLGITGEIDKMFEIAVATFSKKEEQKILKYLENGEKVGNWLPMKFPQASSNICIVKVFKISHFSLD